MLYKSFLLLPIAAFVMSGCVSNSSPKVDLTHYTTGPNDRLKVEIPKVCRGQYEQAIPRVAVVPFSNYSTFGKADVSNTRGNSQKTKTTVAGGYAGITPVGIGAIGASKSDTEKTYNRETTKRSVDAKVSESLTSVVESALQELGGMRLISRTDLEKVMSEQQFQQSGLVNEDQLVELGRIAGVKYIVTGSLDNVDHTYTAQLSNKESSQKKTDFDRAFSLAKSLYNATMTGYEIKADLSLRVIDVETAEVLMAKRLQRSVNLGNIEQPTFDQQVGGIKSAAKDAIEGAEKHLLKYFKVRGYVMKLKSLDNQKAALINVGSKIGIRQGQHFMVYAFDEVEDPLSGKKSCDMTRLPVSLKATNEIQEERSWMLSEGKSQHLKLGQLIERVAAE